MSRGTQDEAGPSSAARSDARVASVSGELVPEAQRQDREPEPHNVARQIVLRQLAMAPRSRAELLQKLAQRGCAGDVAACVVDRLTQVGLVDDQAYALDFVRTRQAGRGLARRALDQELRAKGIEDKWAQEALDSISDEQECDRARALVEKKLRAMHGLGVQVQTRRMAAMLARKGYSSRVAFAVIGEAIAKAPEHLPD